MTDELATKLLAAIEALNAGTQAMREEIAGLREEVRGLADDREALASRRKADAARKARQRSGSRDSHRTEGSKEGSADTQSEPVSRDCHGTSEAGEAGHVTSVEPASRDIHGTTPSDPPGHVTVTAQESRDSHGTPQSLKALVVRDLDQEKAKALQRPVTVTGQAESRDQSARKPDEVLPAPAAAKKPTATGKLIAAGATTPIWKAYSAAFADRYGAAPPSNARNNSLLAQLIGRIGAEDAPAVAAFYVGHNKGKYVDGGHRLDMLVANCEGLRTEWFTGRRVTETAARQADKSQANLDGWGKFMPPQEQNHVEQSGESLRGEDVGGGLRGNGNRALGPGERLDSAALGAAVGAGRAPRA